MVAYNHSVPWGMVFILHLSFKIVALVGHLKPNTLPVDNGVSPF